MYFQGNKKVVKQINVDTRLISNYALYRVQVMIFLRAIRTCYSYVTVLIGHPHRLLEDTYSIGSSR